MNAMKQVTVYFKIKLKISVFISSAFIEALIATLASLNLRSFPLDSFRYQVEYHESTNKRPAKG